MARISVDAKTDCSLELFLLCFKLSLWPRNAFSLEIIIAPGAGRAIWLSACKEISQVSEKADTGKLESGGSNYGKMGMGASANSLYFPLCVKQQH